MTETVRAAAFAAMSTIGAIMPMSAMAQTPPMAAADVESAAKQNPKTLIDSILAGTVNIDRPYWSTDYDSRPAADVAEYTKKFNMLVDAIKKSGPESRTYIAERIGACPTDEDSPEHQACAFLLNVLIEADPQYVFDNLGKFTQTSTQKDHEDKLIYKGKITFGSDSGCVTGLYDLLANKIQAGDAGVKAAWDKVKVDLDPKFVEDLERWAADSPERNAVSKIRALVYRTVSELNPPNPTSERDRFFGSLANYYAYEVQSFTKDDGTVWIAFGKGNKKTFVMPLKEFIAMDEAKSTEIIKAEAMKWTELGRKIDTLRTLLDRPLKELGARYQLETLYLSFDTEQLIPVLKLVQKPRDGKYTDLFTIPIKDATSEQILGMAREALERK